MLASKAAGAGESTMELHGIFGLSDADLLAYADEVIE
jgi:hypothetical protein